jgi:hypothetical protein
MLVENACCGLANVACDPQVGRPAVIAAGGPAAIVQAMQRFPDRGHLGPKPKPEWPVKAIGWMKAGGLLSNACRALCVLTEAGEVCATPGAAKALAHAILRHPYNEAVALFGVGALRNIAAHAELRHTCLAVGVREAMAGALAAHGARNADLRRLVGEATELLSELLAV